MNNQVLQRRAKRQAHEFVALMWYHLPDAWIESLELNQFELEIWLMAFDEKVKAKKLTGFKLLEAARLRAGHWYQDNFKEKHHTPVYWAFFRFRLEWALLRTVGASCFDLLDFHAYHAVVAGAASRLDHYNQDRFDPYYNDPSRGTPF
ncbi:hypothetical protein GCM10028810_01620 [Spirosoma litoris]